MHPNRFNNNNPVKLTPKQRIGKIATKLFLGLVLGAVTMFTLGMAIVNPVNAIIFGFIGYTAIVLAASPSLRSRLINKIKSFKN